ncbi:MAG TPA: response regulator [Candidatus Polarisedimenticolaceae bacterium]|nr:response regulator [Candidatus Polarisedimenticolaceae bacterium]
MERSSGSRSARLLLVEDSPADARYLREIFKEAKIRNHLHHVHDAEAALDHLASETPDLILVDMHLPGMQGGELIRAIRADARFSSVPIVALAPSEPHAERLRQEGVDAHCCLLKPISVHALLQWVTKIDSLGVALVTEGEAA